MPRISFPLGADSYEANSLPFSAQRCINMYPSVPTSMALSDLSLYGTPGVSLFTTTGAGNSRGAIVVNGVYYVVVGTSLYEVNRFGAVTNRGTINGEQRVSMAHNGEKLVIVADTVTYQYNTTPKTLVSVTGTANFVQASSVVYKDGYFIFSASDGTNFFISNLSVGSSDDLVFDALDFGSAEVNPDNIISLHVTHDELFVLGEETIEVFQNVGATETAPFPFLRIPGASLEKGAHSKHVIQWDDSFYFVGGGRNEKSAIWKAKAGQAVKMSSDAIDAQIQKFANEEVANAFPFAYSSEGNSFVGFTFKSVNIPSRTFVLNITASQGQGKPIWFEKQSGVNDNYWRAASVTNAYSKLLVSDLENGNIGILDPDTYTEYGAEIRREKITAPLQANGKNFFISEAEVFTEPGLGGNHKIALSFSEDGAKTFSNELYREFGQIGEYKHRVSWRRLGRTPSSRVFKFVVTDPTKVSLMRLDLEVESGF